MNEIRNLLRIVFTIVVGYIVLTTIVQLVQFAPMCFMAGMYQPRQLVTGIFLVVISVVIIWVIVWQFVIKPDKWIERLLANVDLTSLSSNTDWLTILYRLAAVVAGIMLFYNALFNLSFLISNLLMHESEFAIGDVRPMVNWFSLGAGFFQFAFAVWLLFGAPQLVRWHITKIHKMTMEKSE